MSTEYADDPFKAMARAHDAAIVARGGQSIFACKNRGTLDVEADRQLARWAFPLLGYRQPDESTGRPTHITKPGRIMGHSLGILGGGAAMMEFDE